MKTNWLALKGAFIFLAVFVIIGGRGAAAQESQYERDAKAAQAYADAYSARDMIGISAYLADDAVFEDPSSHWEGKDAILEGLGAVFDRVTSSGPENREINKFRSGNFFVYLAWIDFNMMMAVGDAPEKEFNFKLDFMMTLKVDNGKIVEHRDYVDTEAFVVQMQTQMAEVAD